MCIGENEVRVTLNNAKYILERSNARMRIFCFIVNETGFPPMLFQHVSRSSINVIVTYGLFSQSLKPQDGVV
jgi:hypothetical protein